MQISGAASEMEIFLPTARFPPLSVSYKASSLFPHNTHRSAAVSQLQRMTRLASLLPQPSSCLSDNDEDEIYGFGYGMYDPRVLDSQPGGRRQG